MVGDRIILRHWLRHVRGRRIIIRLRIGRAMGGDEFHDLHSIQRAGVHSTTPANYTGFARRTYLSSQALVSYSICNIDSRAR